MNTCRLMTLALAAVLTLASAQAEAQFYRRGAGGGVIVRAPFVGVNVTRGGVSVRAPGVSVNTARRGGYYYRAPVASGPVYYGSPVAASSPIVTSSPTPVGSPGVVAEQGVVVEQGVASPTPVTRRVERPISEADLAAMSVPNLLAALANKSTELHAELGRLSGGEGWQTYLALPEGVAAGQADAALLEKLLARFDSVARDRQFASIAGLAAFGPMRTALRVSVDRLSGPMPSAEPPVAPIIPSAPAAGESLPTPAADEAATEKSILKL